MTTTKKHAGGAALLKLWYGLKFFSKTNVPGDYALAAFHHPDSITWRWSIWLSTSNQKRWCFPKFGPGYNMGKGYRAPNGNFSVWFRIPFIGVVSLNTQEHMWRR